MPKKDYNSLIKFFDVILERTSMHPDERDEIIKNIPQRDMKYFRNYCNNKMIDESLISLQKLISYNYGYRLSRMEFMSKDIFSAMCNHCLLYFFQEMAELSENYREPIYEILNPTEILAFNSYMASNCKDSNELELPKEIRTFKPLKKIIGKPVFDSLMIEWDDMRIDIRNSVVVRYAKVHAAIIKAKEIIKINNYIQIAYNEGRIYK